MVRAIQVGLGGWGFSWAKEIVPTVERVAPVAYVDANPEAIRRVQTELGVAPDKCFLSLEEAIAKTDADLVLATLRTEAHHPVVGQALDLGFNVLVEKPFASTLAQARDLVARAEKAGRILMVSQNYRHNPAPHKVAEMVANKTLGDVNLVSIDFRKHAPSVGYRFWEMPDPLLADMAIHHFDLMRMVLGDDPKRVSCRTWNTTDSQFVHHPIGVATLEFEKGTVVSYRGSWMSGAQDTAWSGAWSMDCSKGEIWWSSRDHRATGNLPDIVRTRDLSGEADEIALPKLDHLDRAGTLNAIATAIETGRTPPHFSSGQENLLSFALVEATIRSASQAGAWVEIGDL
ncbi:Gfo/Idh/MocA family protein [Pelagibacterium xiamenense]|uniref:Gfo/Idh/MocA family protein n=1 Tax=Pelagibacterium xiamenense TaxID=2901140 RepID=UPI001E4EE200|nr:Gfo/Idh/MocA family oxidoreductase [Pelagibacterium xiamenense]MCD7060984.1 Gfo/Idh/MocA family oxidoreductase [Pelagibacterium xiamenense]